MSDDHDEAKLDHPWPAQGQRIFVSEGRPHSLACVNFGAGGDLYISGFHLAARIIAKSVLDDGEGAHQQDKLLFPLLFNYRHCIELQLKLLVELVSVWNGPKKTAKLIHELDALWELARPTLLEISPNEAPLVNVADGLIRELHAMDPGSMTFRYATTRKGDPSIPTNVRHIDFATAAEHLDGLVNFLDAVCSKLKHDIDERNDFEAAMAQHHGIPEDR